MSLTDEKHLLPTNPKPWRAVDPAYAREQPDCWIIVDANGDLVAMLGAGSYESDRDAAQLIVRVVNEAARC